jgi:hypothetical protein
MNFIGLICVILAQYISGSGLIRLIKPQLAAIPTFCLSMITGVAIISLAPCTLQLLHIPITANNTAIALVVITLLCSLPLFIWFRKPTFGKLTMPNLYEIPFILVFIFFIVTSAARCFYFPPTPRDVLAGSELLAEFTVREKTMLNSVFNIDLHTTNNQYKSPFLTSMQIIYKLFVCPFGQVWLTTIFIPFILWLYTILKTRIHGFLACLCLLVFFSVPDGFAYTYIMLYDYSNMIFFFAGMYFLGQHLLHKRNSDFAFSVVLFGIATYIRVETLVFAGLISILPAVWYFREKVPVVTIAKKLAIFMAGPVLFYVLCMNVFVAHFVPGHLDTASQMNKNLTDVSVFFTRLWAMNNDLIFSSRGVQVYGYFFYFFVTVLLCDLIFIRKFNKEARIALFGIAAVYFGLAFLGYLLPLFDLMNTTKRGLFKFLPLALLYYANSGVIMKISDQLTLWENRPRNPSKTPVPASAAPRQKNKRNTK